MCAMRWKSLKTSLIDIAILNIKYFALFYSKAFEYLDFKNQLFSENINTIFET